MSHSEGAQISKVQPLPLQGSSPKAGARVEVVRLLKQPEAGWKDQVRLVAERTKRERYHEAWKEPGAQLARSD